MKKLVMLGAGGHGKVCAEIAKIYGYEEVIFLDDKEVDWVKVAGRTDSYIDYIEEADFFVSIGRNSVRENFCEKILAAGGQLATLIHPRATVSETATIECGTVVMAGAVINASTTVGKGSIINTCSSVDHDNKIGDYVHIAVGAHLSGGVTIEDHNFIGAGAIICNNISVTSNCIIGAASAIIDSIEKEGTYVGVPARKVR